MTDKQVLKIRQDFPWFKNNPKLKYLDSSATSLKPKSVVQAIEDWYFKYCTNTHNTDSVFAYKTTQMVADVRKQFAKHLNVKPEEVIFTSGATESLNLAVFGLKDFIKKGDEIIVSYTEHTSNFLPWQMVANEKKAKLIFASNKPYYTEKDIINKVTKKTKAISICNASNILGYDLDFKKISIEARKKNPHVIIVIDATQAIPHRKYNVGDANIDCLAFSGHKMVGPTGIGICYINKRWLNKIKPYKFGGGMNSTVCETSFEYADGPDKFEGGTPNLAGIVGLGAALKYLDKIGWEKIHNHELELKEYADKKFAQLKNIEYYSKPGKFPILFFNLKGLNSQDLAAYLANKGFIVRSGVSCVKMSPLITEVEGAVRASLYVYNTRKDIDDLVNALKEYKKGAELDHVVF